MSGLKDVYTKIFLSQANMPTDDKTVRKYLFKWWRNPRQKLNESLTLTDEGFDFVQNQLNLKCYKIEFPKDFTFTTQIILWLDHFIDCPNYYTNREIYVFKEKKAAELILFSGDVRKYGTAKAMARQREIEKIKY
jgi:hypothetical protein